MNLKNKLLLGFFALMAITILVITWTKKSPPKNWAKVEKGTLVEAVYGVGTLTPKRSYQLKVGVSSTLKKIYVEEGQVVEKGTPLVEMETTFRAPFKGTITSVSYKEGETVFAQTPILTLVDLTQMYALVSLEQQGAIKVKPGQKTVLNFEGVRNEPLDGHVSAIFSHNGQFFVHVSPESLPSWALPGMTVDIAITVGEKKGVVLIPVLALKNGTLTIKRGKKTFKESYTVGKSTPTQIELLNPALTTSDYVLIHTQ